MFLQTLLLALTERGLGTCVEVSIARYPEIVRAQLAIPTELSILCGLAIGYPDPEFPANKLHIAREPIGENADHRYARFGMTAAMVLLAAASTFVRSGFGYMIFPYTIETWRAVDRIEYVAMMIVIAWMAWGMTSNISCFRPEVAERIRCKQGATDYDTGMADM